MAKKELPSIGGQSFENLKQVNDHGAEYWSARDLQPLLGYSQWRRFEDAIKRALTSCEQSGNNPDYHFAGAGKMIGLGKGAQRALEDYQLSRFACYLTAQNGDPRKPEIALQARAADRKKLIAGEKEGNTPLWREYAAASEAAETAAQVARECGDYPLLSSGDINLYSLFVERAQFPGASLADLYDPLTMPPALLKAHQKLDATVDMAYGKSGFKSDAERVAFLFERYQALTSLLPVASVKRSRKKPALI